MCRRQKRRPPPERGRRFINSLQGSLVGTALSRRRILKSLFMPSGTNRPRLLPGTPGSRPPRRGPRLPRRRLPRLPPHRRRRLPSPRRPRPKRRSLTIPRRWSPRRDAPADIPEAPVPQGDLPQTGSVRQSDARGLGAVALSMSAALFAGGILLRRKEKNGG